MKESQIIRLCLLGSVSGIFVLYFLSASIEPVRVLPQELDRDMLGKRISISGVITDADFHPNGHIFLEISNGSATAQAVIWEDRADYLRLRGVNLSGFRKGAGIEITGNAELYKGRIQLVV